MNVISQIMIQQNLFSHINFKCKKKCEDSNDDGEIKLFKKESMERKKEKIGN